MNSCLGTSQIKSDSNIVEFLKTMQIRNERVFDACKVGNLQDIIDILQKNFFIDTRHKGVCLVHVAAEKGHLSVVEYLVNQKADINAKDKDGKTPLGVARKSNLREFIKSKGGE